MVSVQARRKAVAFVKARGTSERRACTLMGVARSSLRYRSKMDAKDAPVMTRMRELSAQYPRYGYRRIRVFLRRDGMPMGRKRAWRIWNKAGLQVPRKRPRRRVAASRPRPTPPRAACRWCPKAPVGFAWPRIRWPDNPARWCIWTAA